MPNKSRAEEILVQTKRIIAAVAKTNPAVNALYNIAREELLHNEKGLHLTPGYGKLLAEKYFPLNYNPANSFYAQSMDPRSIDKIKN